jgi:nitrogen fixation protein FixH
MNPTNHPTWNPWPYALCAFFAVFITCVVGWTTFAIRQKVDLVGADYYEQEIRFQSQIDRVARTSAVRGVEIRYLAARQSISISLPQEQSAQQPTGTLKLYRPSDSKLDQEFPLAIDRNGRQEIEVSKLSQGFWKARLTWSAGGREFYREEPIVIEPRRS